MKQLVLSLALWGGLVSAVSANCISSAMPLAPSLPSGHSATYQQMAVAQASVKAYINDAEQYLGCIFTTRKYNKVVAGMHRLAKNYNNELRVFKSKTTTRLATTAK